MSQPILRLSMPTAFLIENLRTSSVSDQELIHIMQEQTFNSVASLTLEPEMNFAERFHTAESLNEPWKEAILSRYQIKFLHLNGVKKLLKLRFNRHERKDYIQSGLRLHDLTLDQKSRAELEYLIQGLWNVSENHNTLSIEQKY